MNKIVNGVANDFEFETLNKEKINIYELGDIPNIYLVEELQERIDKAISMLELSGGREKISKDFVNIGRKRYDEILKILKGE